MQINSCVSGPPQKKPLFLGLANVIVSSHQELLVYTQHEYKPLGVV